MGLLACISYRNIRSFPSPFSIGVRCKLYRTKQVTKGSLPVFSLDGLRFSNTLNGCSSNGERTLFYNKLNARVGCLCSDLVFANNNCIGINDSQANELCEFFLTHALKANNLIFSLGKRFVCQNLLIFDFNGNGCGLNNVGTLCFTRIVEIVNFKVVVVFACIGVVLITVQPSRNLYINVCCVGRLLASSVVSEVSKNVKFYFTLCYVHSQLCFFENCIGSLCNKAYAKGSLTCVANSALGIIKLPSTCCVRGKSNVGKLIPIGRFDCGKLGNVCLVVCSKGHVFEEDIGNFRRPTRERVAFLLRGDNAGEFGSVQSINCFKYFAVYYKIDFVLYANRNGERLSRIVQVEHYGSHPRRIDVGGYHRCVNRNFGGYTVLGYHNGNQAQINCITVSNNALKFLGVQLISHIRNRRLVIAVGNDLGYSGATRKEYGNGSDPNDYSLYNFFFHNFLL